MRHSSRGEVDPFIVMDVMEAARAAEAAGRRIIHMEVGQPGHRRPQARGAAWPPRWRQGRWAILWRLGFPSCARGSRSFIASDWYGVEIWTLRG